MEFIKLSNYGYHEKYVITPEAKIIDTETQRIIQPDTRGCVSLKNAENKWIRKSIKTIYREAYGKEFCYDNIPNLPNEEWEEIPNAQGKYFISTEGRIKSYCGLNAIIRKPEDNGKGYLRVDLFGKYKLIHLLMAETFLPKLDYKVEIHHIDTNPYNNKLENLIQLTPAQHQKIHNELNRKR